MRAYKEGEIDASSAGEAGIPPGPVPANPGAGLEGRFGEWTFSYVVTEAVPRSAGPKVRFRDMSLFELEGGRVARYPEYFDTGAALLQLGFAPESLAKVLAKRI